MKIIKSSQLKKLETEKALLQKQIRILKRQLKESEQENNFFRHQLSELLRNSKTNDQLPR